MTALTRRMLIVPVLILIALAAVACEGTTDEVTVKVALYNQSQGPVEMWLGHDAEPPTGSDVEPAGLRWWTASVSCASPDPTSGKSPFMDGQVTVNVRSNGVTKTETRPLGDPGCNQIDVVWDGQAIRTSNN